MKKIIIYTILLIISIKLNVDLMINFYGSSSNNITTRYIAVAVGSCVPLLLFGILIMATAGKSIGKKMVEKETLSKDDFNKEKEYFRNIVKEYCPTELLFLNNLDIKNKTYVVLSLLNMYKNKIIDINDDGVKKLTDTTTNNIDNYVLSKIQNNAVYINSLDFNQFIMNKCISDNLIIKNNKISFFEKYVKNKSKYTEMIAGFFIIFPIIILVIAAVIFRANDQTLSDNSFKYFVLFVPIYACSSFYIISIFNSFAKSYEKNKESSFIRTSKGNDINKKLNGLKNFLLEFSDLENGEKEEIMLWDEYLIYSVMFDQNTKIYDDISKFITIN